jgi:uncharacterized membrane protein
MRANRTSTRKIKEGFITSHFTSVIASSSTVSSKYVSKLIFSTPVDLCLFYRTVQGVDRTLYPTVRTNGVPIIYNMRLFVRNRLRQQVGHFLPKALYTEHDERTKTQPRTKVYALKSTFMNVPHSLHQN